GSVLNPANYQLQGDLTGAVAIQSVSYDRVTRTAFLSFDGLNADNYTLTVKDTVKSIENLGMAAAYTTRFQSLSDFSAVVRIRFFNGRGNNAAQTYTYDVQVTNIGTYDLFGPMVLTIDGLKPTSASVLSSTLQQDTNSWWLDLTPYLINGKLSPNQTTITRTITFSTSPSVRLTFVSGVFGRPYPNTPPVFDSNPVRAAAAGPHYSHQAQAHDPDG